MALLPEQKAEIIGQYATAFRKVAEHAEELQ